MNKHWNLLTGLALAGFASSAMAADLPARVSPLSHTSRLRWRTEVLLGFAPGWSVKTEYRLAQ
jgi:hypothetical protein